jgi:hypothetical protein
MRTISYWVVSALAVGLGGCGVGAMGQAVVSDACKGGDPACTRSGFDAPLALGATAHPEVRLGLRGSAGPGFHIESAAPSILAVDGSGVTGAGEGTSALLFVSDRGAVLDFLHVWVKKPDSLRLSASEAGSAMHPVSGPIELFPGESIRITAAPFADGQALLGSADAIWTVDPPIAMVLREGSDGERRLVAGDRGKGVLHVKAFGLESTLDIVVHDPRARGGAS